MVQRSRLAATLTAFGLLTLGPFALVQGLLFLEHKSPWHSQEAELLFVITGVAIGVLGLWMMPIGRRSRGLLTAPYALLMAAATWFSALPTVCSYFGDCM